MKNVMLLLSAAVMLLAAGCTGSEGGEQEEPDLEALYAAGEEACGWTAEEMTTVEGELMDAYYPGLNELDVKQLVAKVPAMSSVVNEIVLVRCGTEEDAEKAVEILQARIDAQVQGDAWYADALEVWKKACVLQEGTCAVLIASGDHQADWENRIQKELS